MIEIANSITSAIQSGNILWLALLVMISLIANYPRISEYLEGRRKQRVKNLLDALECSHLDENFKDFLKHELSREYFLYVTDIAAEKEFREELIRLNKLSKGEVPFFHYRRASSHLRFSGGKVWVNLDGSDIFGYYMNFIVAIFFGLVAMIMFMMPAFVRPMSFVQVVSLYGIGALFMSIVVFALSQTFSIQSAKRIKRFLAEKQETVDTDESAETNP